MFLNKREFTLKKTSIIQGNLGTPYTSALDSLQHIHIFYAINLIYAIYMCIYMCAI